MAEESARVIVFAGPTLARARQIDPELSTSGLELRGPAARHDIARAAVGRAGVIALVDGLFHQSLSVGHVELREAIAAGWQVWGVASMGAIRAREIPAMRGFGCVFETFQSVERDVRDDEVMLLHAPGPDFRELSEPLIHLRAVLKALVERRALAARDATSIEDALDAMYFGDRTLAWFQARVRQVAPDVDALADIDHYRHKSIDLIDFLRRRPWAAC